LILTTIDRIKEILAQLEMTEAEPQGADDDLIEQLHALAEGGSVAAHEPVAEVAAPPVAPVAETTEPSSGMPYQVLERPLRPGEVSL
ncbi:UNVERIFIED_CONTAM: hypothetical protein NY603_30620, partial [Bacteroidetes bacterium 56_B9]